jgi:hypothetical protein
MLHRHRLVFMVRPRPNLGFFRAADAQRCHASAAPFARYRGPSASMLSSPWLVFTVRPRPNLGFFRAADVQRHPRSCLPRRRRPRRSVDACVPAARQAVPFDPEWDSRDHVGRVPVIARAYVSSVRPRPNWGSFGAVDVQRRARIGPSSAPCPRPLCVDIATVDARLVTRDGSTPSVVDERRLGMAGQCPGTTGVRAASRSQSLT